MSREPPAISGEEMTRLIRGSIPMSDAFHWEVRDVWRGGCLVAARFDDKHGRAGGTVSGPMLFTLADTAMYVSVLSVLGVELLAVTADTTIHFLRKPSPAGIVAEANVLRRGKRLIVVSVAMMREDDGELVAHATGSYAIP